MVILPTVVIYYSTVSLSQITIKNRAKSIAWIFIPVIFLAIFLTPTKTEADITNFTPFVCLFEKTTTNSLCPNINPAPSDIKKGTSSGVIYGKTEAEGITTNGIKTITMQLGLWMDILREKPDDKYYYNRVADDKYETFILRIRYKKPGTEQLVYKLFNIPYQEGSIEVTGGRNPQERTITVDTANGGTVQNKIAFYKTGGDNGDDFIKQQVILAKVSLPEELPWNHSLTADFWYCGGLKDNDPDSGVDGRRAPRGGRVEYFTSDGKYEDENGEHSDGIPYGETKCDGTSYFQIGKTETFTLPISAEAAQEDSKTNLESGITATEYTGSTLPLCSVTPWGDGSVVGCVAQILYHGVFRPVAFFAMLMGKLFDFFIGYSLSDESYRHDFIQTGWQLVRDISNIFFIIIMIYSGLAAVFGISKVSYKSIIPALVINALIINFSLFATRIVIDMSNITARIFYNQMVVKVDGQEKKSSDTDTGFKPISEAIVSSFNPQKIFEGSVLSAEPTSQSEKDDESDVADFNSQSENQGSTGFKRYSKEYAGYFILVTLVAIAISFSMAMMFWKTAFMFIGRVIGLYVAMIFSPFAFLSRGNIPLVNKIGSLNFSSWWGNLSKYALLAPIFIFFLYIINAFLNVEFFTKVGLDQNGQGFFGSVMYVVIPMLIIYGLVSRGVKIAEALAGEYAQMAQKFATGAAGVVGGAALGVATGGLAFAGTRGAGLLRLSEAKRASLAETRSRGGISGRIASLRLGLNDRAQSGSFDLRKTKAFSGINNLTSKMGVKLDDKISGTIGLGSDATKGGMKAIEKKEKEDLKKKIESIKTDMKDSDAAEFWEKKSKVLAEKEKGKMLKMSDEDLAKMYETYGKSNAEIEAMKTSGTLKNGIDDLSKKKVSSDYGNVTNNKQLTQALRLQFAETIAEGKTLGQSTATKVAKGLGIVDAGALLGPNILLGAASTPISAAALMTGVYDSKRSSKLEKEEATSYAKKAREAMNNKNKLPKEERLENEKKEIEKELESIDATLKKIFDAEVADRESPHFGKSAQEFFDNQEMATEAVKKARTKMKNEMDVMDIDIEFFKKQYHDAMSSGNTSVAETAKKSMSAKINEKNEKNQEHYESNPETKHKKQADLNKKDDELEKIKEKSKKDNEKKPDEKK